MPAHVVGDLHQGAREHPQGAARAHDGIVGRKRREFVRGRDERLAGLAGDLGGRDLAEAGVGVDAGADRGAAERQGVAGQQRATDALEGFVELRDPAGHDLLEGDGRRVLQMRAPDHDDLARTLRLGGKRVAQALDGRKQLALDLLDRGDVHHGREGVVRGLAVVDVVIGVDRRLGAENARPRA